jgi:hypothetical protein
MFECPLSECVEGYSKPEVGVRESMAHGNESDRRATTITVPSAASAVPSERCDRDKRRSRSGESEENLRITMTTIQSS